jgi:glycosyltransferase involved in cell wall biosynthesis
VNNEAPFLFDVTRLIWRRWEDRRPTGIDRVCLAYLAHFGERSQAVIQHRRFRRVLDRSASAHLFDLLAEPRRQFRQALSTSILAGYLKKSCPTAGRFYLNVGHTGLNEPGYGHWLNSVDARPIYLVHDQIPITHPEFCRDGEKVKHLERMRTILSTATGVIGNSEATLADLEKLRLAENMPAVPTVAALLGSDAVEERTVDQRPADRPYFVVVGTIEARKNHLLLLHVWSRLVERLGDRAPLLLVIGQRGWESEQAVDLLERSDQLKGAVREINHCDDRTLSAYLSGARALLFPSLVEGYGLPIVEALRAGTPVIASDLPVFREVAGNVPDYLDPIDGPAWERLIVSYGSDPSPERKAQQSRISGYRAPSWNDHFGIIDSWLATL